MLNTVFHGQFVFKRSQRVLYNGSVAESPQRALVNDSIAHEG